MSGHKIIEALEEALVATELKVKGIRDIILSVKEHFQNGAVTPDVKKSPSARRVWITEGKQAYPWIEDRKLIETPVKPPKGKKASAVPASSWMRHGKKVRKYTKKASAYWKNVVKAKAKKHKKK